jgi:hypothetical protein
MSAMKRKVNDEIDDQELIQSTDTFFLTFVNCHVKNVGCIYQGNL